VDRTTLFSGDKTANFREVALGGMAPGILYRSAHPVADGFPNEAVLRLVKQAGIKCVLNLDNGMETLREIACAAPWYESLIDSGSVAALDLDFDFTSPEFTQSLRRGFLFMLGHPGPYLIHCWAGVDRTGIVCAVLEGFMGAKLKDIAADYRRSFENGAPSALYHGEARGADSAILQQLAEISGGVFPTENTIQSMAETYLRADVGLGAEQLEALRLLLSGKAPCGKGAK
jgi:protein tyrosine/serine phosphatase